MENADLIELQEAAEILGVSIFTVRMWRTKRKHEKHLTFYRSVKGRECKLSRADVEAFAPFYNLGWEVSQGKG